MYMPLNPSWDDIALRLALTLISSAVIGFNRESRGHAAGLRTTILVGLAASAAMIQANILLSVAGKTPASFGVMDLMRLPLGILTGVGFIGGGTILKRGDLVTGVTTAATLWVVTVIGLCLGGGQLWLGVIVTILTVATLFVLELLDRHMPREQNAELTIASTEGSDAVPKIMALLSSTGFKGQLRQQSRDAASQQTYLMFEVNWKQAEVAGPPLDLLRAVEASFPLVRFELVSEARR
jgi:putative Mg2+ transporter-C (MgtC) family protein